MAGERIKRAALYARVSTLYQVDKDSLPVQKQELENYCKYAMGIDSFEVFEDAGYSGKNTDRPQYQQMMARMRKREFTHLVVWKIDRISRNLIDFAEMYQELKDLGVTFVSKNEQFDTSTAIGEAMLKIILVFAELERKITAERVSSVMISRASNGKWNGGRTPYGYSHEKRSTEFTIVESEAEIITDIFDRYEGGDSLLTITKYLNQRGLRTRGGGDWNIQGVWTILSNPFYYGALRYNFRNESKGKNQWSFRTDDEIVLIENHHPAIITKQQFDACQAILNARNLKRRDTPKTYKRKNCHVFAGLITCGCCGSRYRATIDVPRAHLNGYRQSIYLCARRRKDSGCTNKYIADENIGAFVLNYIANLIRAKNSFGKSTSIATLQKKLLRGPIFAEIDHIERPGLDEMRSLFQSDKFGESLYLPVRSEPETEATERDILDREKRRIERAIDRLKSAYLFDEHAMGEAEYITQRQGLIDQLNSVDDRLRQLGERAVENMSDEEFIARASYFALEQELLCSREVDYMSLIRGTDPEITKDFVNSVCSNFCILDGKITAIRFKNGIEHRFVYKTTGP